jgi:putative DNA methylase
MSEIVPFSLKDAPALIEKLLPVQKVGREVYKERMAGGGQLLTSLGNYWKGRKPLILNKACILGCMLPATGDDARDLEIFELLMGMDAESIAARLPRRPKPAELIRKLTISRITDYFVVSPEGGLPTSAPVEWKSPDHDKVRVEWRADITEAERRVLEAQMLPKAPYRDWVDSANRPDEIGDDVHVHIWDAVNRHLGTSAQSFPELTKQLGIMRFGHQPTVADTFSGSGQIPFEAARLGCHVYASDLNPIACMLTWGAFSVVGGSKRNREMIHEHQDNLVQQVFKDIDSLGIETDEHGWRGKVYLYCVEARCPETGWMVPLLPTLLVSKGYEVVAQLVPDPAGKRYDIVIKRNASGEEMKAAERGTVRSDGRGKDPYLIHTVAGKEHRTNVSTLRGDESGVDRTTTNRLRQWEVQDFKPRPDDIFQERLYCVQWMKQKKKGKMFDYEFRSVTEDDLARERVVEDFLEEHFAQWQENGWIPDMKIESGYNTDQPIRERGWTYWHHLFNPRQLLINGLWAKHSQSGADFIRLCKSLNINARLSVWHRTHGGGGSVQNVFNNQALNTLFDYGSRGFAYLHPATQLTEEAFDLRGSRLVESLSANQLNQKIDLFVTDPPYGDAVKYEEIYDFFISWIRKNPPPEFADWIWDSRRELAIKGQDNDFKQGMIAAYRRMTECMPENGMQVIMFTHQSGSIWADMASIVWASGLHVTAAWYVVTETDSALREGSYVKGTILLVCRKRQGNTRTRRDELAFDLQDEVEQQVERLTGLNQQARRLYRDENVFEDADLQMAGYAAALRVLTQYSTIDGRDMVAEAQRPRVKGEKTFVDDLIEFSVATANQFLVPHGLDKETWKKLKGAERFYLKMTEMEARGIRTLDNYQNFAKAFKVRDFGAMLQSNKANSARLKSAADFAKTEMNESSELGGTVLRGVLYALWELGRELDTDDVIAHLKLNVADYLGDASQRELAIELADYLALHLTNLRPEEASKARILSEAIKNQKLGG